MMETMATMMAAQFQVLRRHPPPSGA
eukprot:COSAG05_NODE_12401_length_469_cov_1.027027_1_plen_25_part_01